MTNEEANVQIAKWAAEDAAADAAFEAFKALGRSHAAFAIDSIPQYEDSRSSHEENLHDTLFEHHRDATAAQIDACLDAYHAAWDAFIAKQTV